MKGLKLNRSHRSMSYKGLQFISGLWTECANIVKFYLFRCPHCGEYQVTKETFKEFCPQKAWQKIQDSKAAIGGLIAFKESCPKCQPTGQSLNKIILLKRAKRPTIKARAS